MATDSCINITAWFCARLTEILHYSPYLIVIAHILDGQQNITRMVRYWGKRFCNFFFLELPLLGWAAGKPQNNFGTLRKNFTKPLTQAMALPSIRLLLETYPKLIANLDRECHPSCEDPCQTACKLKCDWSCEHERCSKKCSASSGHISCDRVWFIYALLSK